MSDISKEDRALVAFILLTLFVVIAIALTGWTLSASWWEADSQAFKVEAVRHGAAEWRTDENGQVSFHWKTNPVKP